MSSIYYILNTPEFGRGLYANCKISAGSVIARCELLVLSKEDTLLVNETDLKYYTFKYTEEQDCLVLGDGEIFNHSDRANVAYRLSDVGDRKLMLFVALSHIEEGDQLFIDYGADVKVDVNKYIETKSLI
jgi:SET domain-containing protein